MAPIRYPAWTLIITCCAVQIFKVHSFESIALSLARRFNSNRLSSRGATCRRRVVSLKQSPCDGSVESQTNKSRRRFILTLPTILLLPQVAQSIDSPSEETPFHSAAYGREEYTNSIVASRDTNISPKEVYDTIASEYLKEAYDAALKEKGGAYKPRALDVGAGAGVSTEVLYRVGYRNIDALDWSGTAWNTYVVEDPSGHCSEGVTFYELDDERYLDKWRDSNGEQFNVIVFNFAVNESKAKFFAKELLSKNNGRLLAPINTSSDYWLKQTYKVIDGKGDVLWSATDVGAWSVQFQPDVTQDTCSGVWCAPFNGFQKKR